MNVFEAFERLKGYEKQVYAIDKIANKIEGDKDFSDEYEILLKIKAEKSQKHKEIKDMLQKTQLTSVRRPF